MTRVILLKDVPRIGKKYEVKEVSGGYATNFLFPNKLAEMATAAKEAALAKKRDLEGAAKLQHAEGVAKLMKSITGSKVVFKAKADETGHLFKKLRAEDVAHILKSAHGTDFTPDNIPLEEPISTTGHHTVQLISGTAKGHFDLVVEKE